jgi:hypothetical protein
MENNEKKPNNIAYFEIILDSWKIVWKNRYLWWLGFFVALGSGGGMNFNYSPNQKDFGKYGPKFMDFFTQNIEWIAIGIFFFFIIFLAFAVLGILARGGLIDSVKKHFDQKVSGFRLAMKEGKKFFWKLFLISLVLGLFALFFVFVLAIPVIILFANGNPVFAFIMAGLAVIIAIPIVILTFFVKNYAFIYTVLGKLTFWSAIENGYNLFQKNIASSILMSLIIFLINISALIVAFLAIITLAIVFLGLGIIFYFIAGKIAVVGIIVLAVICFLAVFLFARSVCEAFVQAIWILFFMKIARTPEKISNVLAETEKTKLPIPKTLPAIESERE